MLERHAASDRTFVFALALVTDPAGALARLTLESVAEQTPAPAYTLPEFCDALRARHAVDTIAAPGLRFKLSWN